MLEKLLQLIKEEVKIQINDINELNTLDLLPGAAAIKPTPDGSLPTSADVNPADIRQQMDDQVPALQDALENQLNNFRTQVSKIDDPITLRALLSTIEQAVQQASK